MTATPVRFAVAQRSTAECLGLFADAQGLFAARGIAFHLAAFETAGERGMAGLLAGEWDYIEIGVSPLVPLIADGHDPVIIAGTTPVNTNSLMGRRDIADIASLDGGRIGCLSLGGQTAAAARAVLAPHGLVEKVELAPFGTYSKIFDAVAGGEIEGAILAGDIRFSGEVDHGMRLLADIGAATGMPGTCVVTTRREIARDADLARGIVGAYADAVQAFRARPDAAKGFLSGHLHLEDAVIERVYDYYRSVFPDTLRLPPEAIKVAIDVAAKQRPDVSSVTPDDLLYARFVDELPAPASATSTISS